MIHTSNSSNHGGNGSTTNGRIPPTQPKESTTNGKVNGPGDKNTDARGAGGLQASVTANNDVPSLTESSTKSSNGANTNTASDTAPQQQKQQVPIV